MSFETGCRILQKDHQCVGGLSFLGFKMLGRVGCTLPKPHCKQVSHLHIVEGALPLTEIAFAMLLSLFGFLFCVCCSLYDLVFRIIKRR